MRKNNAGYTLVELIVSIAAAALVFAAASSFMLLGLRMEKGAADNAAAQNESNIIMRALETIAAEGRVGEIVLEPTEDVKWYLCEEGEAKEGDAAILGFNEAGGFIFGKGGIPILYGVEEAEIGYENNVLTCGITTEKGDKYESSVYCRVGVGRIELVTIKVDVEENKALGELDKLKDSKQMDESEAAARKALLATMLSQYGSTGKIDDPASLYDGLYYSQWYKLEWGRDTPWCSIFVSWCIETMLEKAAGGNKEFPWMGALVDTVMWYQLGREPGSAYAVDTKNNIKHVVSIGSETVTKYTDEYEELKEAYKNAVIGTWQYPTSEFIPNPGDLVFFENDDTNDRADHVGVVLYVENDTVYTIEGNHNNRVGIFSYPMQKDENATEYIIGYGILNWSKEKILEAIPPETE